jgi:ubiquinone/menaquinone biosynthesis C-methylase UbiE
MIPAGARFHEEIAAGWARGYSRRGFGRRRKCFADILDRHVAPDSVWLDLGCGAGVLTMDLLERGARVVAVDGAPGMIREARALVSGRHAPKVTWLQGDVQGLSGVATASVDGVLCSSVAEYVERPHDLLLEAARALRPEGRLIVSVPPTAAAVRVAQKAIRRVTEHLGRNDFPYLAVSRFELAPDAAAQWLAQAGFHLDRITRFDPILPAASLRVLRPALLILEAQKLA